MAKKKQKSEPEFHALRMTGQSLVANIVSGMEHAVGDYFETAADVLESKSDEMPEPTKPMMRRWRTERLRSLRFARTRLDKELRFIEGSFDRQLRGLELAKRKRISAARAIHKARDRLSAWADDLNAAAVAGTRL